MKQIDLIHFNSALEKTFLVYNIQKFLKHLMHKIPQNAYCEKFEQSLAFFVFGNISLNAERAKEIIVKDFKLEHAKCVPFFAYHCFWGLACIFAR